MAMPIGTDKTGVVGLHATLHNFHYNVKAFGAVGDNNHDDTQNIADCIAAAYTARQPVFFPATANSYKITSTIDLTSYIGMSLVGEGSRQGINGALGRGSQISAASTVSPMFKFDGSGNTCNLSFENLMFNGAECAVRLSDCANATFRNCTFSSPDTGGANNTNVLLENVFWAWFDQCHFNAPSTSDYSVILRGKEPSPDVDHCYLIRFADCRFWLGGVLYKDQNDIAVGGGNVEAITFQGIDTESFDGNSSLIQFTKTASTNWGGRYVQWLTIRNVNFYDFTSTPAVVRYDVPNGFKHFVIENLNVGARLFERGSGTGQLDHGFITGILNDPWPLKDSSGTSLATNRITGQNGTFNVYGQSGLEPFIGFFPSTSTSAYIGCGSGTPEGAISAPVGSLWLRTDGGAGTSLYVKQSGTGNTGWVGK